jgi:hypothetical protein
MLTYHLKIFLRSCIKILSLLEKYFKQSAKIFIKFLNEISFFVRFQIQNLQKSNLTKMMETTSQGGPKDRYNTIEQSFQHKKFYLINFDCF